MGWNTVVLVLNDALTEIQSDGDFGKRLVEAIRKQSMTRKQENVAAHSSSGGIHCNAATVICSAHADEKQLVEVGQNWGERLPNR